VAVRAFDYESGNRKRADIPDRHLGVELLHRTGIVPQPSEVPTGPVDHSKRGQSPMISGGTGVLSSAG
jgi:hypothetical protein